MYKIAILGCENSHAKSFLKLIKSGKYPDIEVIGIYSDEPEAVEKLHEDFGTPIMADYADAVDKVDGIMITARHGDNHLKYARPYLDSGIPMFIDKPITCSEEEAVQFMRISRDKGIRLCGGSTCANLDATVELSEMIKNNTLGETRGGYVLSPIRTDSPYGGFFFYAEHLVDIMTKIFGEGVNDNAVGTKMPRGDKNIIKQILFALPSSKKEQTAIANVLSSMDKEIETLNTKLEKYRNLKTAMMQQLLTGKIRLK